jgi:predicted nucleic acid-binding protein
LIYLDSSALVKLAITEPESAVLARWLAEQPNLIRVSSSLIRVEVPRAIWRAEPAALQEAYQVIRRTREVRLTDDLLARAARLRPAALRAFDAVHLASALAIRPHLDTFVSYDKKLLMAAAAVGIRTASPG